MADSEQKSEREAPRSTTRRRFLTDGALVAVREPGNADATP